MALGLLNDDRFGAAPAAPPRTVTPTLPTAPQLVQSAPAPVSAPAPAPAPKTTGLLGGTDWMRPTPAPAPKVATPTPAPAVATPAPKVATPTPAPAVATPAPKVATPTPAPTPALDTGQRGAQAFQNAKNPNSLAMGSQQMVLELDRIPNYKISDSEKVRLAHQQATILGWSAADMDAYYGFAPGTTSQTWQAAGLAQPAGDGKMLTAYQRPDLHQQANWFNVGTQKDGDVVRNPDGSYTVYRADSFGSVGGQTYNPDGTARDPGGPRQTINQALAVQREPHLASSTGPSWAMDPAGLLAMNTAGYLGSTNWQEMNAALNGAGAGLNGHFSTYLPANGGASRPSSTDGRVPLVTTPPGGSGGGVVGDWTGDSVIQTPGAGGGGSGTGGGTGGGTGTGTGTGGANADSPFARDQLAIMLNQDTPYMRAAKNAGLQTAASRGLLNSSLAAEAAQKAAIEAAGPIASQDAEFLQKLETMAKQQGYTLEEMAAQFGYDIKKQNNAAQWDIASQQFTADANYRSQYLQAIGNINMQDMNAADKDRAVQVVTDLYRNNKVTSLIDRVTVNPDGTVTVKQSNGSTTTTGSSGTAPVGSAVMPDWASYETRASMPANTRATFEARYGTYYEPKQVMWLESANNDLVHKLTTQNEGISTGGNHASKYTGVTFNKSAAVQAYDAELEKRAKAAGVTLNIPALQKVFMWSPPPPKEDDGWRGN